MSQITSHIAAEINRQHELAVGHAEKAVEHAREAGRLLLQIKSELAHGAFLPWVEQHLAVSARQAQRYMRVAQGKLLPPRAIANTTRASYLCPDVVAGEAVHLHRADGPWPEDMWVIPSAAHPGYFYMAHRIGGNCTYTRRPVRVDAVPGGLAKIASVSGFEMQGADIDRSPHAGTDPNPFAEGQA